MARIAGVELQDNWKVDYALTNIKGIGWSLSGDILKKTGVDKAKRVSDLTSEELASLATEVEHYAIEGELMRQVRGNVKRLQQTGAYRGQRHSKGLPVRGQRTRTNARTKRGKRKTVGAFKKEELTKQPQPETKEKQ